MYQRFVLHVCEKHPEHFPPETFNFELFLFAWNSIQVRVQCDVVFSMLGLRW